MVIEKCPMNTELKLVTHSQGFSISTVWNQKSTPLRRGWLAGLPLPSSLSPGAVPVASQSVRGPQLDNRGQTVASAWPTESLLTSEH